VTAATPAPATTAPAAPAAPTNFLGLEPIDFVARGDGGMGILSRELTIRSQRLRRQRCGPRAGGKRDAACRKSKGEFQKVPAFHDIFSSAIG
jgi:hypothetical protein